MTCYVLVHGAYGGAHTLRHVRQGLMAAGHSATTPSLTGIGERVHLASPLVTLTTHIRDVTHHVLYEDLKDIVLLGFSYGGFVVTGALEHIADRVSHLVYLDAFVPRNGESVDSHVRGQGRKIIALGEDWLQVGPARDFDDPVEGEWMASRRTAQPRGTFTEPVFLAKPLEDFSFSRTYIKATVASPGDSSNAAFQRAANHAAASPAWRYFEISTNHMVPVNRPGDVVRLLLDAAKAD